MVSSAPSQSRCTSRRPGAFGTATATSASVASTNGTLMAKIQRHEAASTSQPPASGPITIAIPDHAVHDPIAPPRSSGGKAAMITASALGVSSAPNTPCSARPMISTSIVGASAQTSETTPKPPTPIENTRRSPYRSPSEPATRISEPSVSRYAFETHCWPASPPPRSSRIAGSATLTTVASSPATNEPMIAATRASCFWRAVIDPTLAGGHLLPRDCGGRGPLQSG